MLAGRLGALSVKYFVEMETLLMLTEAAPVFDAEKVKVLLVPAVTLPKSRLALLSRIVPTCVVCWLAGLEELNPWQPTMVARARRSSPTLTQESFAARDVRIRLLIIDSLKASPKSALGGVRNLVCGPEHDSSRFRRFILESAKGQHPGVKLSPN